MGTSDIGPSPLRFGFLGKAAGSARDWRPIFFVDFSPVQFSGLLDRGPLVGMRADHVAVPVADRPSTTLVVEAIVTYPLHGVPPVLSGRNRRLGSSVRRNPPLAFSPAAAGVPSRRCLCEPVAGP